ncbi:MAG: N-acetylmuramoyl-L-alanine amidase [Micromonosporaceae bacterium]|nr:N-acetylmuramoyl-L-alanine amidase [Micromonosporaceae bacterium]
MPFRRILAGGAALSLAALASAVVATPASGRAAMAGGSAPAGAGAQDARQQAYQAAAAKYGVPVDVLLGVSYLESRWDVHAGSPSTAGGFGPMHLTDAAHIASPPGFEADQTADARGDDSRPARMAAPPAPTGQPAPHAEVLQTLHRAAALTGASEEALRADAEANIDGGAALLRSYQESLGGPVGADSDIAAWYGAVARYSGGQSADDAAVFADEVYATIAAGAARTTDDGHRLTLAAHPGLRPDRSWLDRLRLPKLARPDGLECPVTVACEWIPAPYEDLGGGNYGNHDLGNRPQQQKIEYIVIHDTETDYQTTLDLVQDPTYLGWHYTLRSVDGHIAQHIKAKDVGWHAGNWYVNAKSIGIEHEGFAAEGTWFTEAMYRSSAKLVRYLALRLGIPLDRHHIIGHDNVPGITPAYVAGMHWDPGPYWDWAHYFDLLHAPFHRSGGPHSGLVTINPDFATNQPAFTGCTGARTNPCPPRGSSEVILHSAPSQDAPLVVDVGLHPDGAPSTMYISDHGARASTGQVYAVADRQGDWTAIWYLGQKAWFYNPRSAPTAEWTTGLVATPKPGKATIPVYGRAYPEAAAYPAGVPVQEIVPLQYTLSAGQRYSVGNVLPSEYYRAVTFDGSSPGDWTVIRGQTKYVQIQFGHRIGFVKLDDVQILPSWVS